MKRPPVIQSLEHLKQEIKLVDALSDIKVTLEMMDETTAAAAPTDNYFTSLKCDLIPIDKKGAEFDIVSKYITPTLSHIPVIHQP